LLKCQKSEKELFYAPIGGMKPKTKLLEKLDPGTGVLGLDDNGAAMEK